MERTSAGPELAKLNASRCLESCGGACALCLSRARPADVGTAAIASRTSAPAAASEGASSACAARGSSWARAAGGGRARAKVREGRAPDRGARRSASACRGRQAGAAIGAHAGSATFHAQSVVAIWARPCPLELATRRAWQGLVLRRRAWQGLVLRRHWRQGPLPGRPCAHRSWSPRSRPPWHQPRHRLLAVSFVAKPSLRQQRREGGDVSCPRPGRWPRRAGGPGRRAAPTSPAGSSSAASSASLPRCPRSGPWAKSPAAAPRGVPAAAPPSPLCVRRRWTASILRSRAARRSCWVAGRPELHAGPSRSRACRPRRGRRAGWSRRPRRPA
mmetsp:Transcript_80794/g.237436  ORF Transcript_80794/g.237436 Transcript_80794/m.237436 type:complete len:331 (+) Transcript_80794:294-1286(+)